MKNLMITLILLTFSAQTLAGGRNYDRYRKSKCVSEDTLVLMSDGSHKKIIDVKAGDQVINQRGGVVEVLYRIVGPEKPELYKIVMESGKVIKATENHPFVTQSRHFIKSQEIAVGMQLITIDGAESVTEVSRYKYAKNVFGLLLVDPSLAKDARMKDQDFLEQGWQEELRRSRPFLGLSAPEHSLVTGGIISGDAVVQGSLEN